MTIELGAYLAKNKNNNLIIPIISKDLVQTVNNTFPFLGNINYILMEDSVFSISNKIHNLLSKNIIISTKYTNILELSFEQIYMYLKNEQNYKLKQVSEHIRLYDKIEQLDIDTAFNKAKKIILLLLSDFINIDTKNLKLVKGELTKKGLLNKTLISHIDFIFEYAEDALDIDSALNNNMYDETYIENCARTLKLFLNWYINNTKTNEYTTTAFQIINAEQILYNDLLQVFQIEKKLLPHDMISSVEEIASWYETNIFTLIGIKDIQTNKLVGFFNTLPITEKLFEEILNGNFIDVEVPKNEIRNYDIPGFYKLYISSICIDVKYRHTNAFKVLYNAFIDFLLDLAVNKEIYISDIIADAITGEGEKLCEAIGMKKIKISNHNSKIYKALLIPPEIKLISKNGIKLIQYYKKIYKQYQEFID